MSYCIELKTGDTWAPKDIVHCKIPTEAKANARRWAGGISNTSPFPRLVSLLLGGSRRKAKKRLSLCV